MQVPYEYRRSQTLASKFARSALTQRQFIKQVDSSVGYFAVAQYDVLFLEGIIRRMRRCVIRLNLYGDFVECGQVEKNRFFNA